MKYQYYICDVFTVHRFRGNQLAVLPDAAGLNPEQMQQIAREFNFSETAFVFLPEDGSTRRVRIFTPTAEIPFAGHPNIGTAFVLAATDRLGNFDKSTDVTFEEKAGLVKVAIRRQTNTFWCELTAPEALSLGPTTTADLVATAISLGPDDIVTATHPPLVASVGLPFLFAELRNVGALGQARINMDGFNTLIASSVVPDIHLYVQSGDEFDIRTRMFAPLDGVPEDPATGSANCALAGLLCRCAPETTLNRSWKIAQGVEMGRPSELDARAEKIDGNVTRTWVGGTSILVSEGWIEVD